MCESCCSHTPSIQMVYSAVFIVMIRRPPRSTHCISSAASDVYKRQILYLTPGSCILIQLVTPASLKALGHSTWYKTYFGKQAHLWHKIICLHEVLPRYYPCLLYTSPSPRDQA
eukprot:TRINITY_DN17606_c0_g1_i1.p1 TRINITY_DN17606_c0_g1~~TRINITY_DN17606_c0_g1_i1.p1  ORF type:complete len:114 (+),score=11.07 TRINITY_DN17606_c0_g1_i1:3-344(+)